MGRTSSILLFVLLSGCASTQPVQDTAELASKQLLRLETEVQAAARTLYARYEQQQEFAEQNVQAATEAEGFTDQLRREWEVAGNKEASRLYNAVLSTRPAPVNPPAATNAEELTVSTSAIKKAIKDLGAVNDLLADQNTAEAFLRFGHKVQEDYKDISQSAEE